MAEIQEHHHKGSLFDDIQGYWKPSWSWCFTAPAADAQQEETMAFVGFCLNHLNFWKCLFCVCHLPSLRKTLLCCPKGGTRTLAKWRLCAGAFCYWSGLHWYLLFLISLLFHLVSSCYLFCSSLVGCGNMTLHSIKDANRHAIEC